MQSAAGAGRMARRMRPPIGMRAWKPAVPGKCAGSCRTLFRSANLWSAAGAGRMARRMRPPFGMRAWKPAVPEAMLAAGHFLERGLLVRSKCGAQGAAHAPAHWRAGLEARGPGKMRWQLQNILPERGLAVRSGCGAHGAAHAPAHWRAGLEARGPGKMRASRMRMPLRVKGPVPGHVCWMRPDLACLCTVAAVAPTLTHHQV